MTGSFPSVPDDPPFSRAGLRMLAVALKRVIFGGGLNVTTEFTLRPNESDTTVSDPRITAGSFLDWMPMTQNAAAEKGNWTMWPSSITNGSVVFEHANSSQADRTFRLLIIGG